MELCCTLVCATIFECILVFCTLSFLFGLRLAAIAAMERLVCAYCFMPWVVFLSLWWNTLAVWCSFDRNITDCRDSTVFYCFFAVNQHPTERLSNKGSVCWRNKFIFLSILSRTWFCQIWLDSAIPRSLTHIPATLANLCLRSMKHLD